MPKRLCNQTSTTCSRTCELEEINRVGLGTRTSTTMYCTYTDTYIESHVIGVDHFLCSVFYIYQNAQTPT